MASKKKSTGRTRANGAGTVWIDPKTGSVYGVINFTVLEHGKEIRKKRARKSISGTRTEANEHIKDLLEELDVERRLNGELAHQARKVNPRSLTFGELAQHHKDDNLQAAEFDAAGIKTKGVLAWQDAHRTVDKLVAYFGKAKLVSAITIGQIRKYKETRLSQSAISRYKAAGSDQVITVELKDENGKPRRVTFATVHRELACLKRMLNYASEERWLPSGNPMRGAKDLINPSLESKRTTIATQSEELELLDHCMTDNKRKHLAPYLMTCFDHALRSIEARRMLVRDVDFAANKFAVYSYKGKKRSDRSCVMTPRVREALLGCCAGKNPDDHVFTYDVKKKNDDGTTTIERRALKYAPRRSFGTAKREAARWSDGAIDLSKFRGHDMRHTMITRALARGASLAEVAKYAGHTQPTTTWRYNNPDDASGQRIADLMATYHEAEVIPFTVKKQTRKRA